MNIQELLPEKVLSEISTDLSVPTFSDPMDFLRMQVAWRNERIGDLPYVNCPQCRNRGFYAELKENGEIIEHECSCMKQRICAANIERSGLGRLLNSCTFQSFRTCEPWQANALQRAMQFAESPDGWLYIAGQSGAGKTHLCTAICRTLLENGMEVQYVLWRELLHELEGLRFHAADYRSRLDRIKAVPVLYIDDFLKGLDMNGLKKSMDYAFEVINARYNGDGITLLSSELYLTDVTAMDPATGGRITERAKGHIVQIKNDIGRNYRVKEDG